MRAFYRTLGFTQGIDDFPLTNIHSVARALGMFDICNYELDEGEVILMPHSLNTTGIDLLQFKYPFNPAPPYSHPNHLGMAYAALLTADLEADVALLEAEGAEFLSQPYGVPGNRFVFLKDPDGVFLKLVGSTLPQRETRSENTTHIVGMPYIGINVSDLDRSLVFYAQLGYDRVRLINEQTLSFAESKAWGFDEAVRYKGADIAIGRGDHHRLRLLQWLSPFNPEPAYPPPINHKGINRLALTVSNLDRAENILKNQGVQFLSEVVPCCSGSGKDPNGIVHIIDPDGVFLELVGAIDARPLTPPPPECPAVEVKYREGR